MTHKITRTVGSRRREFYLWCPCDARRWFQGGLWAGAGRPLFRRDPQSFCPGWGGYLWLGRSRGTAVCSGVGRTRPSVSCSPLDPPPPSVPWPPPVGGPLGPPGAASASACWQTKREQRELYTGALWILIVHVMFVTR